MSCTVEGAQKVWNGSYNFRILNLGEFLAYPTHLSNKKAEAQNDEVPFPRLHSLLDSEPEREPRSPSTQIALHPATCMPCSVLSIPCVTLT